MPRPAAVAGGAPVGVLCVHGVGSQRAGWSLALERAVRRECGPLGVPRLVWAEATWSEVVGTRAEAMWGRVAQGLGAQRLRALLFSHAADAVAYQPCAPDAEGDVDDLMAGVHAVIDAGVAQLRAQLPSDGRVLVVAHSLGTIIVADWLRTHAPHRTLDGLVTMGSPIPVFAAALLERLVPPAPRWLNLFDGDDPLGYPLAPISASYRARVRDVRVRNTTGVFGWLHRLRPVTGPAKAHTGYDANPAVHEAIARELCALVAADAGIPDTPALRGF